MTESFSFNRPARLPKTSRFKNESFRQNPLRVNSRREKINYEKPAIVYFDRSACETFISDEYSSAIIGSYHEKFIFLNKLHELMQQTTSEALNSSEFFEKIGSKVIVFIKDDYPLLRALSFRIIRLCLFIERNLIHLLTVLHVDIYVVRGLDLRVENEVERIEALQLISRMIHVYQTSNLKNFIDSSKQEKNRKYAFPRSVMQPVIAIALSAVNITGVFDKETDSINEVHRDMVQHYHSDYDRLALPCITVFLEFCICEPMHILNMAGTDWMVRVLTGTAKVSRRIASMVGRILVHWLDDPVVRVKAQLHLVLEQIFAPLIEFGFFQKNPATVEYGESEVERILDNFSYSFLCILRSWSGLIACSAVGASHTIISSSPLRLLEYLGLGTVENANLHKIRDVIVDICCEFMDLPYSNKKFKDWNEAVDFYGSIASPDSYESSLKEDFVLAQSDIIMRYSSEHCNHVDLLSSFRAFAFLVLVNAGLPQALSRLIVTQPDAPSGIKATLLMADMLKTAPSVVPSSWSSTILSMPTLIQSACEALANNKAAATTHDYTEASDTMYTFINAKSAELVHHRFDILNRVAIQNASRMPSADSNYSLFLHVPRSSSSLSGWKNDRSDHHSLIESCWKGDNLNLKVVSLLYSSLLDDIDAAKRLDKVENINNIFVKLLSKVSCANGLQNGWSSKYSKLLFVCARNAILFSLDICSEYPAVRDVLTGYAKDFKSSLDNLSQTHHLFSVKNLSYGGSMYIFSLIGAYSSHVDGVQILESLGIFQHFIDMMNASTQTDYVKVIVSCLNYNHDGMAMIVLQKALTSTSEVARRWCTRFVGTLASLGLPNFDNWGMRLLLGQLGDSSVKVVRHAIRILHVWLPVYTKAVRLLRNINLDAFGEAGILLQAHIYSIEDLCGDDLDGAKAGIHQWMNTLNERYVQIIDDEMRVSLLSVKRTMDGSFSRSSGERLEKFGVRCPIHLFGALARHETGRQLLMEAQVVKQLMAQLHEDEDVNKIKGALLALGHIGGVENGMRLFSSPTIPRIIKCCEEAPVLSVRGTAFWALNILAASVEGARALADFGWESNRHRLVIAEAQLDAHNSLGIGELRRGTLTPVIPEIISEKMASPTANYVTSRSRSSSDISGCQYTPGRVVLRRSRSDAGLSTLFEKQLSIESMSTDVNCARFERTLTGESGMTSGIGSVMDDSIGSRRRATTTGSCAEDWETRSRSSTVAQCLTHGLVNDRTFTDSESLSDPKVEPHFASRMREKWRLTPMQLHRCLEVNRNIGDPVSYFFMTAVEEQNLSIYRQAIMENEYMSAVMEWQRQTEEECCQTVNYFHITALPVQVDVMCMNIFSPRSYHASVISEMEDRGAKSGHGGRSQRTDADLTHSAFDCFYCSANSEKYPLPTDDVAVLRRRVLNEVDMLEIKESGPERKLISLRAAHPWLFEWPCLYADVLELLDEYRFKARSRAFLQEIFYNALKL